MSFDRFISLKLALGSNNKKTFTFDNAGNVQISPTLTAQEQLDLGLTTLPNITVTPAMLPYLAVHQSKLRR